MRRAAYGGKDLATTGIDSRVAIEERRTQAGGRRGRDVAAPAAGIAGVVAAALLAAALLAAAIVVTGRSALWMAAGAGILVGHGVRIFGKDDGLSWGIVGAALAFACCVAGDAVASGIAGARHGSVALADIVFRPDPGAGSAMIRDALRPACLASDAVAVGIGYVVVREKRFEESFQRLLARYRH